MSLLSLFNKAARLTGRGLASVFNRAAGNKALADRGLARPNGDTPAEAAGLILSSMAPLVVAALLTPAGLPLAFSFATAAAIAGVIIPARAQASSIIKAAEQEKAEAPKSRFVNNNFAEATKKHHKKKYQATP